MSSFVKTILKYALTGIIFQILTLICLQAEEAKKTYGVISSPMLNIRSGPDQSYPAIRQLTQGQRVSILKTGGEGEWIKIEYQGEIGFIRNRKSYILIQTAPVQPAPKPVQKPLPKVTPKPLQGTTLKAAKESGVIASDWLHVRSGPGTNYPSIILLKKGARVDVLKQLDGWLHIGFDGGTGFIRNREIYIKRPTKRAETPPEKTEPPPAQTAVEKPPAKPKPAEPPLSAEPLKKLEPPVAPVSVEPPEKREPSLASVPVTPPEKSEPLAAPPEPTTNKIVMPSSSQRAAMSHKVEEITQKIEDHEEEAKQYSEKEQSIINGLDEIEISLNILFQGAIDIRKNLTSIENKVADAEKQLNDISSAMATDEEYIAKRVVSLYKLSNIGNMPILASSDSMYEFFTRKTAMDRILEEDAKIFENYSKNRDHLVTLKKELESQKTMMMSLTADYDEKIRIISNQKEKRAKLLRDIRRQKTLTIAAIDMLRQAQTDLEQKIQSRYQQQASEREASSVPDSGCVFRMGDMTPPVNGEVVSLFGQGMSAGYHFNTFYNGIDIKTERGEPIQALCGGTTIFSDWLRGYGNLIIVDHGNDYYTVYAHAEELFKKKGDPIESGEVIGTVGESGSTLEPKLYFEIRHHGKPIDPLTWLKKG